MERGTRGEIGELTYRHNGTMAGVVSSSLYCFTTRIKSDDVLKKEGSRYVRGSIGSILELIQKRRQLATSCQSLVWWISASMSYPSSSHTLAHVYRAR